MITQKDIEKLKETFATKNDLSNTTKELLQFMVKIKDEIKTEVKSDLRNEILLFKDAILFEIKSLREEVVMIGGVRDMVEDHEIRLVKLESK